MAPVGLRVAAPLFGWPAVRWLGVALVVCGLPLFVDFLVRFVREGRGTPAPIAPMFEQLASLDYGSSPTR